MPTVLTDQGVHDVAAPAGLLLTPADTERVTGWTLKPEGLCRDELCMPLAGDMLRGGRVDVAAFWRHLGNPVVSDRAGGAWVLGTAAGDRQAALTGLQAPDFVLPDLAGTPHRLSDYRGKKVFLTTWASW